MTTFGTLAKSSINSRVQRFGAIVRAVDERAIDMLRQIAESPNTQIRGVITAVDISVSIV